MLIVHVHGIPTFEMYSYVLVHEYSHEIEYKNLKFTIVIYNPKLRSNELCRLFELLMNVS